MSCLFDYLIGVIEQDQAVGATRPRKRGCMKSPENMADNDAEADNDEVRILLMERVFERAYVDVWRPWRQTPVNRRAVNKAKREYGQANKGPWWMP